MFLQIGSYRHQINEAGLAITQRAKETKAGVPYMYELEWTISGKLRNPSGVSRDLDRKMAALEQAYSTRGVDIALLHNDGRRTHHAIRNSDTLGGIRTLFTAYPTTSGAEYCTYRSYQVQITASIPIRSNAPVYIEFEEQITIMGGGRRWAVKEVNEGPGIRQQTRTHSKCEATQSGRATMLGVYPMVPQPIWPFALQDEFPRVNKLPPVTSGQNRDGTFARKEMTITWDWSFVWPQRLFGSPHYATR